MNLKKSALLAEIFGGVGIIVSILYLGYEVSENTKNTRISNHLALQDMNSEFAALQLVNPELVEIVLKGSSDLTSLSDVERNQFELFTNQAFNVWETAFLMQVDDVLPEGTWDLWNVGYCDYMNRPGFRAIWSAGQSKSFTILFGDIVNACFSE
ncbi:MAG: hypothetical protein OEM63_08540 [Gammaproteobacteria bacterium]|nr:hypothetical protein [Gammaproteobacteria bacterium]